MGLKVNKLYDPVGGCFYELDMGLLCTYAGTFGATMTSTNPWHLESVIVHGKDLRRAYKQRGRNVMEFDWAMMEEGIYK
jgi:hypothetical protein